MFSFGDKIDFLIGSPFSTPVGQRIERATSGAVISEDWGLNMEICDIINETDDGPRDAVKAIRRRIVANNNFQEILLTLTVLETCVKNCGHRFHALVAVQDFIEGVLVRAILPKYNPPSVLTDRVLSIIQSWADAFRNNPSLSGVVLVYEDLRRRGLEFPMTDLDALSPIHTPSRSIPENGTPETAQVVQPPRQSVQQAPAPTLNTLPPPAPNDRPVTLSAEQEQKLQSELALVKGNLRVMSEILNELTPGHGQQDDVELLEQLYTVCKSMQTRVVELIPRLLDEELIAQLLVINDELNNAFIRYESVRYEDPGAMEGLAGALDTRLQVTGVTSSTKNPPMEDVDRWLSSDMEDQSAVSEGVTSEEFDRFLEERGKEGVQGTHTMQPPTSSRPTQSTQ
ncbi:hypothetical protein CRUP_036931, partial [Coryphaenoides rupestris]